MNEDREENMEEYREYHMGEDREEEIRQGQNYRLSVQRRDADSDRYEGDEDTIGVQAQYENRSFGEGRMR